jgi:formate transporter
MTTPTAFAPCAHSAAAVHLRGSASSAAGPVASAASSAYFGARAAPLRAARLRRAPATREPPAPVVAVSTPLPEPPPMQPPAGALTVAEGLGAAKAAMPAGKVFLLGCLGGAYIGIAGLFALSVGGAMPGIAAANPGLQKLLFGLFGLPFGLTLVLTAGAELFTGNTALVTAALLAKRATLAGLLRNWVASFIGNFVGALFIVWLATVAGVLCGPSVATAVAMAKAKTSLTFSAAFARGVVCNWLVCLAVWLASSARDMGGKFVAVVLPISAFVAMGMDHSIANMFLIPMGMRAGAKTVTIKAFLLGNLLPVTLGNIVGGAVLVAGMYHLAFARPQK